MKKFLILFILFCCEEVFSQSFSLFDIDATNFPTIRAKFYAIDANGNQITNLSPADFEVKENGIKRNVTLVTCPAPKPPQAISSVLVIDVSGSMAWGTPNILLAKEAARTWINGLPLEISECAITAFDHRNYLIQDFTTDRNKLLAGINKLIPTGSTDYDMALINPPAGGLIVTQRAKYKRVIVFLSDGMPNREPKTDKIIQEALAQNLVIFGVTLGMPCPDNIKQFTTQTGGMWFENVTTVEQACQIYQVILQTAQGGDPCTIEWQSGTVCELSTMNVEVKLKSLGQTATASYNPPANLLTQLSFEPMSITFKNKALNTRHDTTVKVTAINGDYVVSNITSSNPLFTISPTSFNLNRG